MPKLITIHSWNLIHSSLVEHFGAKAYDSWLKFLTYEEETTGRVYLSVPSRFLRDWITSRYAEQLLALWKLHEKNIHSIEILVKAPSQDASIPAPGPQNKPALRVVPAAFKGSESASFFLDSKYTFENFVVGKPNELAYAAAQRVATSKSICFNPLFLHGGVGLGKTHLMQAIAMEIQQNQKNRKVLYMSAEQFMYRFVSALRHKDVISFREQFRSVDVLMIDDVQFISGKESTQEEFFHTFNALVDKKKQIVLSADKSPAELAGLEERVRSRLGWGLVVDIHPTTYELRLGILESKCVDLGLTVPHKVLEFLAHKITSNIRELEGALTRILAHSTLVGKTIGMEMAQEALRDLLRANMRYITIEDIQKQVAEHYHVRVSDMHSSRRLRVVVRPRQVAMYLSKNLTQHSLPEIGRKFGGRDHTTVMHAVKKVQELIASDPVFRDDVEMLENVLKK